jgi:hypothetical protein
MIIFFQCASDLDAMKLLSQLSPVRMDAAPDFLVKAETDEAEFQTRAAPTSGNPQQPPAIDDSDIPGLVSNFLVWLLSISISVINISDKLCA